MVYGDGQAVSDLQSNLLESLPVVRSLSLSVHSGHLTDNVDSRLIGIH